MHLKIKAVYNKATTYIVEEEDIKEISQLILFKAYFIANLC